MYDMIIEVFNEFKSNWGLYSVIIFIVSSTTLYLFGVFDNDEPQEFKGSLSEAVHNILLLSIPGICRDEFVLDDTTKNTAGEWITVHGSPGKKEFSIIVEYKTVNGRISILWVESNNGRELSSLIKCNWISKKPFRNR